MPAMIPSPAFDLLKARIAHLETLTAPEARLGVTHGGYTQDMTDGSRWYMKRHSTPEAAYSEHLANQIYRHVLGKGSAPHSVVLHEAGVHPVLGHPVTRPVYLSKHIDGFQTLKEHHNDTGTGSASTTWNSAKSSASHFLRGTAADMLVGNNDLHSENVGLIKKDGVIQGAPVRIDNGANFMHDGWGHPTDEYDRHDIFIRHREHNSALTELGVPGAQHLQVLMHPDFLRPQVEGINRVHAQFGGWHRFVNAHIPSAPPDFRQAAGDALEARHTDLKAHVTRAGKEPLPEAVAPRRSSK